MKKFLSLLLTFVIILPSNVFATEKSEITIESITNETTDFTHYLPLEDVFISFGGEYSFDICSNIHSVVLNDKLYTFMIDKDFYTNGKDATVLKKPLIMSEDKLFIHYDDVAFLYEVNKDIYKNTKKEIVSLVYNYMYENKIPGLTLSFVDIYNNYTWTQGFGFADKDYKIPVTDETLFNIASISKSFTALGIMNLVEKGIVNLDEKVTKYLPDFKLKPNPFYGGYSNDVTVRMLLAHYSGINGDIFNNFQTNVDFNKSYMNNYIKNLSNEYMTNIPGKRQSYSNSGYAVLANIIASVTNKTEVYDTYVNYMNTKFFEPLGMKQTGFNKTESNSKILSLSYLDSENSRVNPLYINNIAAGGVYSNAKDMSQFLKFMLNKGTIDKKIILKPETIDKMITPYDNIDPMASLIQAHGTYITPYNGTAYVGHGGDVTYFHSDYQLSYEHKLGIFVSGNSSSSVSVPNSITLLALDSAINERTNTNVNIDQNIDYYNSFNDSIAPEKSDFDINNYKGYYISLGKLIVNDDESIKFENYNIVFKNIGGGTYTNEYIGNITFKTIDEIEVITIGNYIWTQKTRIYHISSDFNNWLGNYKAVTNKNELALIPQISFVINDDNYPILYLTINGVESTLPLYKVKDNIYMVLGIGRNLAVVLERVKIDGDYYIKYNGTLYEKVIN